MNIELRYETVKKEVVRCCIEAGRKPDSVRILAVSKTIGVDVVEDAVAAGICEFGENRPDELALKQEAFPCALWHFVGNIQSRRIPDIVAHAELIHSLYKEAHLPILEKAASALEKIQKVLIEVNVSGEQNKGGIDPQDLPDFLRTSLAYPHIKVSGLMTMAPQGDLPAARECFRTLHGLQLGIQDQFSDSIARSDFNELSMGMSEDWREAIAEGATIVRIGRALFREDF